MTQEKQNDLSFKDFTFKQKIRSIAFQLFAILLIISIVHGIFTQSIGLAKMIMLVATIITGAALAFTWNEPDPNED